MKPYQLALALSLCELYGCSWQGSMRSTVSLSVDAPRPHSVQAWGYPSTNGNPDDALYYSISIELLSTPPFNFTFPDGYVINSKQVTSTVLEEHLAPITKGDKGKTVSRVSIITGKENYSIIFTIGQNELAENLSLYTCKHVFRNTLSSSNGVRTFDFPIKQREIAEIFGGPLRIGHDFVILGYECN
jgi:hypothetical protein